MKRTLITIGAILVFGLFVAFGVAFSSHTRSVVVEIESKSVSDFEALSKSLPDAAGDVEVLRSPGTNLWLLSVRASSESDAEQRMIDLTRFLHDWGVVQSHHPGKGSYFGSAVLEHERTKGNWGRLRTRFNGSVPFFR